MLNIYFLYLSTEKCITRHNIFNCDTEKKMFVDVYVSGCIKSDLESKKVISCKHIKTISLTRFVNVEYVSLFAL